MTQSRLPAIPKYTEVEKDPGILKTFNEMVTEEFRAHGGMVGGPFKDSAVVLLTMTGAKSGQPRVTPLVYFTIDGRIIIVGTYGGAPNNPAWVHNLRANARAYVEIGAESYGVIARELSGDERDEVVAKLVEFRPRMNTFSTTARLIPVFELQKA